MDWNLFLVRFLSFSFHFVFLVVAYYLALQKVKKKEGNRLTMRVEGWRLGGSSSFELKEFDSSFFLEGLQRFLVPEQDKPINHRCTHLPESKTCCPKHVDSRKDPLKLYTPTVTERNVNEPLPMQFGRKPHH